MRQCAPGQDLPVAGRRPAVGVGHLGAAAAAHRPERARHGRGHGRRRARRPHALEPGAALPAAAGQDPAGRHARSVRLSFGFYTHLICHSGFFFRVTKSLDEQVVLLVINDTAVHDNCNVTQCFKLQISKLFRVTS